MIIPHDLAADLEICLAATPGLWESWDFDCSDDEYEPKTGLWITCDKSPGEAICNFGVNPTEQDYRNAKAIVEAHNGGWEEAIRRALAAEARVTELEAERDALKARLAEVEAGAAAMREALELFVALSDAAKRHNSSPHTVREFFRWDSVPFAMARAALSSDAGREAAERMRGLEDALRSIPYRAYSEALAEGCDAAGAWDAFREQCEAHGKRALEGGEPG